MLYVFPHQNTFKCLSFFFLFNSCFALLGLELRAYTWSHSTSIFLWRVFSRYCGTICLGCLWTAILLVSASWVARIIGVSHQHPAYVSFCFLHIDLCVS
jgi:hypothetical protein